MRNFVVIGAREMTFFVVQKKHGTYGRTDGPTDRRTDRRTDTTSYRDATAHLKTYFRYAEINVRALPIL